MDEGQQEWQSWVRQLVDGDEQVAGEFWELYGLRLQKLADNQLNTRFQRRIGADDIAQSACRTFLRRAQEGQFDLADSEGLWRLLCAITVTKVRWYVRFHQRKKRALDREENVGSGGDDRSRPTFEAAANDPTPQEAAQFADEFEKLLDGLDDEEQQLVQLKLEQCTNQEIADRLECSERTVRRILKRVQSRLQQILDETTRP